MSWSLGEKERIYSVEEMIRKFSLEKLSKGSPIFDLDKLDWLNGQLISQMNAYELLPYVREEFRKRGLWKDDLEGERREWFFKLLDLLKERSRSYREFALRAKPFFSDDFEYDPDGIDKYLREESLEDLLPKLRRDFEEMEDFVVENIERVLRQRAERESVKAAVFIHALRMLVVGQPVSPGIFDVLELIGQKKTIERMDKLILVRNEE